MDKLVILVGGLVAFAVLGWVAVYPTAARIEVDLQESVDQASRRAGLTWASVHVEGQRAIVVGTAPSEQEQARAREVILKAAGHGGSIWGGIIAVDDQSTVEALREEAQAGPVAAAPQAAPSTLEVAPPETGRMAPPVVATPRAPVVAERPAPRAITPGECQRRTDHVLARGPIRFASASAALDASAAALIADIAEVLKSCPTARVRIGGHTDSIGDERFNRDLSQRRAQSVADRLVLAGVAAERLATVGYGSSRPVAPNATEEGRLRNRRISFEVIE